MTTKLAPLTIKQLLALTSYGNYKTRKKNMRLKLRELYCCPPGFERDQLMVELEKECEHLLYLPQSKQNCLDLGFNPDEYLLK